MWLFIPSSFAPHCTCGGLLPCASLPVTQGSFHSGEPQPESVDLSHLLIGNWSHFDSAVTEQGHSSLWIKAIALHTKFSHWPLHWNCHFFASAPSLMVGFCWRCQKQKWDLPQNWQGTCKISQSSQLPFWEFFSFPRALTCSPGLMLSSLLASSVDSLDVSGQPGLPEDWRVQCSS